MAGGVEGLTVFYEDNGFRDMFIYGSIAMLAALALPSKKAHAAEIYLCGDGRMVEVNNANRITTARQDTCVTSWGSDRQKVTMHKGGMAAAPSSGYQIQTAAIELPERSALPKTPALREKVASEHHAKREPSRKSAAMSRSPKGPKYMGDGIYAE